MNATTMKTSSLPNKGLTDKVTGDQKSRGLGQGKAEPGKMRALISKQESTIQALEARIKDLEAELTTAELSLAHRETIHNGEVLRLRERLAIYEPNGEPLDSALSENIVALHKELQGKLEGIEQIAAERIKVAVIESRLHAKPSFKTIAEKKDDSARKARDEFRNDFIKRLNEEKAELSASLETEIQKNINLNKEISDLRNMIAVLRSDLKKVVQEQVISQRTQNFEGITPRRASPMSPLHPEDSARLQCQRSAEHTAIGSRRQHSQDRNTTQMGNHGSERYDFSTSGHTGSPHSPRGQYVALPSIGGVDASAGRKVGLAQYGQADLLPTIGTCASPKSQSPNLCHSVGRGESMRHQQEVRSLKQRLSILMRSIDDLKDELKCIIGATMVSIREAGLHHVITDQAPTLSEAEKLRFCGCLANNPAAVHALIRLAKASILPPRNKGPDLFGNTRITRQLPLLCTELDTKRLCGLEKCQVPKQHPIEPVISFDE